MKKERVSDQVAAQLTAMIGSQQFAVGDRLPSERALAEQLAVSRPSLREAIKTLTSQGMLSSRRGGGTYVTSLQARNLEDPMIKLFEQDPEYRFDVLETRHALEGHTAYYAALRATDEDKENIQQCFERMISLHNSENPEEERKADAAFHLAITKASHNLVLMHIVESLFSLLENNVSQNLEQLYQSDHVFEPLNQQHTAIKDAILAGDAEAAKAAAQHHITFVETSLKQFDEEEARKQRALRGS